MLRSWAGRRACHRAPRQLGRKLSLWLMACVRESPDHLLPQNASHAAPNSAAHARARTVHARRTHIPPFVARGEHCRARDSATEARSNCPFAPSIQADLKIGGAVSEVINLLVAPSFVPLYAFSVTRPKPERRGLVLLRPDDHLKLIGFGCSVHLTICS